ncbi:MAG: PIG-L deacetylase family protein [Candidatus Kapaibacterium sp.]
MKHKNIIAVGAHPDDIEFGCPVTLRNFIKMGYNVHYVIATNGENGFKAKSLSAKERIAIRKKEALVAARKIGAKEVHFLGFKDGFLEYNESLREKLTLLIKEIKPESVFSFDPANMDFDNINLNHRDHRNISLAVFDAVFAAKNDFIYPDKNGKHRVEKLYFFGTSRPNFTVDITSQIDFKLDVLKSFKSQFPNFESFAKFFKENIGNATNEYKYSETFRVVDVVQISY